VKDGNANAQMISKTLAFYFFCFFICYKLATLHICKASYFR